MKISNRSLAVASVAMLAAVAPLTTLKAEKVQNLSLEKGSTMFFSDRFVTAYYRVDQQNFRTIVTLAPGPKGKGNAVRFINSLNEGEDSTVEIAGHGRNAIGVKLNFERQNNDVNVNILTDTVHTGS